MTIGPLLNLMPEHLQAIIKELIELKSVSAEGHIIKIAPKLGRYIDEEFKKCTEGAKDLPKESFDSEMLDIFFRKTINCYDD
jgi:hypothetical protein